MRKLLDQGDFLSLIGVEAAWKYIEKSGQSDFATIATNLEDGAIRALFIRAKKLPDNSVKFKFKYLYNHDGNKNDVVDFLSIRCRECEGDRIEIDQVKVLDEDVDISNPAKFHALTKTAKKLSSAIIRKNEWVNPVELLEKAGLMPSSIGRKAWPGLYVSGDFKSAVPVSVKPNQEPVFPALFLHAIVGAGSSKFAEGHSETRTLTLHSDEPESKSCILKYKYQNGKQTEHINMQGIISMHDESGSREEALYEIETRPAKKKKEGAHIVSLKFMGQDIDLSQPQDVAKILKVIRNINRTIRAGDQALLDDLKKDPHERRYALPTEMMLYTDAYDALNPKYKLPSNGLMTFSPVGGNNITPFVSDHDTHIGANQYILGYQKKDKDGQVQSSALMIDAGVLFHDIFDVAFFNAGHFLRHKYDKKHKPTQPVEAIMFTHKHKDHLGQLAYLVKCGYKLPALVMNEFTMLQLKRDMQELDIDKKIREEILGKCYPINFHKDVNPQNPAERKNTVISGTTIEQWTEVLPGKELNSYHYYPRLRIGDFEVRVGPMPHSDPGFMYDVITPVGSHRHTGDYKLDNTIKLGMPPLDIWLRGHRPDSMSADSTGATKEGKNPTEADVGEAIVHELNTHPSKRHIFPMLGSNISRLATVIDAIGKTDRKVLIIDGKAVEDLVRDADKVLGLREWAKREYGVEILLRSQKKKVEPYLKDPTKDSEYSLLVSGTQDEAFSSINRAVRDWLPLDRYSITQNDHIVFLQGIIPTGQNRFKRLNLKKATELFYCASVILPECVDKEAELFFHSSGHNNRDDMFEIIALSGRPYMIPVHGGPQQLQAHLEIAQEAGAEGIVINGSTMLRIDKGNKVSKLQVQPSELIGIKLHTPSKEKFYLKGRFSTCVMPIRPEFDNPAAKLMQNFEEAARYLAGTASPYEMAKTLPVSLSRRFNAEDANDFLSQSIPFGIEKYGVDVFDAKNIFAIGAFDTETGGLDANRYLIDQFGLTIESVDGTKLDEVELIQRIPNYRMPSAKALLVTNTDPKTLETGLAAHQFIDQMERAIRSIKEYSYEVGCKRHPEKGFKRLDVKALSVAHNARFDNRMISKEKSRNLDTDVRPQETRGIVNLCTRVTSRALAAYAPNAYKVDRSPDTGFYDHTLEGLCAANGVKYNTKKSHGGLYDTKPCIKLFRRQYEISPDLVGQMVVNADSSTSHLLNDMMGIDTGFNGPHPVFSYVSPSAKKPAPQMGCLVGTMDSERYAVVFNLKYNPNDYMHLSSDEMIKLISNPESDVFEVLDLRQQPIVVPAKFGLRVAANGNIPKETLDRRAGLVRQNLNYVDPGSNWQTIAQKIDQAWQDGRNEIYRKRIIHDYPELDTAVMPNSIAAPTPEDGGVELQRMRAKSGFNPIYQHIHKQVRQYLVAIRSENTESASEIYHRLMSHRKYLGAVIFALNNVHFDIVPEDLEENDYRDVQSMRSVILRQNYRSMIEDIENIESNPKEYERYVGSSRKKQALFKKIKAYALKHAALDIFDDDAREFMRPWRSFTVGADQFDPNGKPSNSGRASFVPDLVA